MRISDDVAAPNRWPRGSIILAGGSWAAATAGTALGMVVALLDGSAVKRAS